MNIRPVSDLRNHFPDVERDVQESGLVFLTKNGYGTMVVMSLDQFENAGGMGVFSNSSQQRLLERIEDALDARDLAEAIATDDGERISWRDAIRDLGLDR